VSAVTVCSVVYVLLGRHVGLTIASLAVMPLMSLINRTWGPRLAERMVAIRAQEAELVAHVQNVSTPRQGRRSANSSYPRSTRTTLTTWWRHARALLAYNWLIGATQGLGAAVVFGYGGWLVHNGKSGLTIGELTLFLSYVGQLWGPLATITGLSAGLSNGASGARRIFEVLDAAATVTGGPRSIAMPGGPVLAGDRQAA
jgi:ABC-type multidrug transport system fused ATPase/permease subunit